MAVEKPIAVGLLLLAFMGLTALAMQFIKEPQEFVYTSEGFETLVTRAADCQCLPGYVPSNTSSMSETANVEFVLTPNGSVFITLPNDTTLYFMDWIDSNYPCELSKKYSEIYSKLGSSQGDKTILNNIFSKYNVKPIDSTGIKYTSMSQLTCDMITRKKTTTSSSYVCQSLSDSSQTKKCY